jgi:YidC/Oxa1 family membrane protein insertase
MKALFFPLANRAYESMTKMKKIQPEMQKLQEKYKEDRVKMQQEIMALYAREKANPISGCLPMLLQIPVFFSLYKVLYVSIEMRHAPFYGWIHDLSAPDPTSVFGLFGLLPFSLPLFLTIGVWPILMGLSYFVIQRLQPPPGDPVQEKVFLMMPLIMTFTMGQVPSGLAIYWTWNNLLSLAQQMIIMRRMGVPIELFRRAPKPAA